MFPPPSSHKMQRQGRHQQKSSKDAGFKNRLDFCEPFMKPSRFFRFSKKVFQIVMLTSKSWRWHWNPFNQTCQGRDEWCLYYNQKNTLENRAHGSQHPSIPAREMEIDRQTWTFLVNATRLPEMASFRLVISCWMLCAEQPRNVDISMSIKLQVTRLYIV